MGGAPFTFPSFFDNRTSQCTHTAPSDQEPPGDIPSRRAAPAWAVRGRGHRALPSSHRITQWGCWSPVATVKHRPRRQPRPARREPRGVEITERAGKPPPMLYTPCQGKRGKYWYKTEIRVQDRTHGHSVFGCARPCVLTRRKEQSSDCICKHSVV